MNGGIGISVELFTRVTRVERVSNKDKLKVFVLTPNRYLKFIFLYLNSEYTTQTENTYEQIEK